MKSYYKACKDIKAVNAYLKKIGCGAFEFDEDLILDAEFDYDGWQNDEETEGVSVQVTTSYEVYVTKYTNKDLEVSEENENV